MNRRRHTNSVQVGSLLKWVVIAIFLGVAGLSYVYMSNQMQRIGADNRKLENDLGILQAKNDKAQGEIAILSSHLELQRRLDEGFIKMEPITEASIVRINVPRIASGEIRPVANINANGGFEK